MKDYGKPAVPDAVPEDVTAWLCPWAQGRTHHLVTGKNTGVQACAYCGNARDNLVAIIREDMHGSPR